MAVAVEPLTGEVFRMPHETGIHGIPMFWFYRHRIFSSPSCGSFDLPSIRSLYPAVRKEKRMYFDAKEFGKRLHDVRTSRGITQGGTGGSPWTGSKQHVSCMENGERSFSLLTC